MSNRPLSDVRTLPEAQAVRVDQACDRFEAAWQAGERPRLEEYLTEVPPEEQALFLAELIPLDIGYRQRRGEAPQTTEYRERFPGLDPAWLARQFEAEAAAGTAGPLPALPGYEVRGELGHGGMGVVYKAWQNALKRVVALKMIKAEDVADAEQLARFHTEAEAVARLQHPSIVHIYDVGQQDGLPYFTMEFVDGGSLAQRLHGTPQPAREAAQLVETLARAMHYAHEHGVVHRDLKPANVLLTAEGTPKITDFGLAKILIGSSREQTESGAILGTPSYMAPEQAGGPRQAIGPAADVYALGALLYELLTGRPPFKGETPLDTLAQVRTQEPVPPGQLQPKLPRDLETICLKCLQKEPHKRYPSALELAEDLRRFHQGEAIRARPVGQAERLWRWCRRQPARASLVGVSVLAVVGLVAGVGWHNIRLSAAVQEAQQQRDKARDHYTLARSAVDQMLTEVGQQHLKDVPGMEPVRRELLQRALSFYRKFLEESRADPAMRQEVARAYSRVGNIEQLLGSYPAAEAAYEQAVALQEALVNEFPQDPAYRHDLAETLENQGKLYFSAGRLADAQASQQTALDIREGLIREHPADPSYRNSLARGYNNLGLLLYEHRRFDQAEPACRAALAIWEQLVDEQGRAEDQLGLAAAYNNLARLHRDLGRLNEAEEAYRKAITIFQDLVRDYPGVNEYQSSLAAGHHNLGFLYHRYLGRFSLAETTYQQALGLREQLAREHPAIVAYQSNLAYTQQGLAWVYTEMGQRAQAQVALGKVLAIRERLASDHPGVPHHQNELANAQNGLAWLYHSADETAKAKETYDKALAIRKRLVGEHPDVPEYQRLLGQIYHELGMLHVRTTEFPEAEAVYQEALQIREQLVRRSPVLPKDQEDLAWTLNNLGVLYKRNGQRARSEDAYEKALVIFENLVRDHPKGLHYAVALAAGCHNKGGRLRDAGTPEAALAWYARAIDRLRAVLEQEPQHQEARHKLSNAYGGRAGALTRLGLHADALQDWDQALALRTEQDRNLLRCGRGLTLARLGEYRRAVAEVDTLANEAQNSGSTHAHLARICSLSAAAARQDAQLPEAEREELAHV